MAKTETKKVVLPITDEDAGLRIDQCLSNLRKPDGSPHPSAGKFRVYYWVERPDAEIHGDDDKYHWHPDSEHDTFEKAEARATALKKGAKRQSMLVSGTRH